MGWSQTEVLHQHTLTVPKLYWTINKILYSGKTLCTLTALVQCSTLKSTGWHSQSKLAFHSAVSFQLQSELRINQPLILTVELYIWLTWTKPAASQRAQLWSKWFPIRREVRKLFCLPLLSPAPVIPIFCWCCRNAEGTQRVRSTFLCCPVLKPPPLIKSAAVFKSEKGLSLRNLNRASQSFFFNAIQLSL